MNVRFVCFLIVSALLLVCVGYASEGWLLNGETIGQSVRSGLGSLMRDVKGR